jgi:hypothetical protein
MSTSTRDAITFPVIHTMIWDKTIRLSKDTNHDNWRIFNEAKELEKMSDLILHIIWFFRIKL